MGVASREPFKKTGKLLDFRGFLTIAVENQATSNSPNVKAFTPRGKTFPLLLCNL
jgi:hypothetical protein